MLFKKTIKLEIFKPNIKPEYRNKLLKAFPKELSSDVKSVLNILPLKNHIVELNDRETHKVDNLIHSTEHNVVVNKETLTIPYRLYFNEPTLEMEKALTNKQKDILNCIFLRHHNGHLREKRLNMLSDNSEKWTIPFLVQLIGEYVFELLPLVDKKVNNHTLELYKEFSIENPKYWELTESRMISYWNVYYRYKFPKLKEYLGFKIINRIKKTNAQQNL